MYCKKCKYYAFDHLSTCPKCGADWEEARKVLNLNWLAPSTVNWLNPPASAVSAEHRIAMASSALDVPAPDSLEIDFSQASDEEPFVAQPPQPAKPAPEIDISLLPELDLDLMSPPTSTPAPASSMTEMPELDLDLLDAPVSTPQKTAPPVLPILEDEPLSIELEPLQMPKPMVPATPKPETSTIAASRPTLEDELVIPEISDGILELDFTATFDEPAPTPSKPLKPTKAAKPRKEDLFIPELEEMLAPLTEDPKQVAAPKKYSFSTEDDILLDFNIEHDPK